MKYVFLIASNIFILLLLCSLSIGQAHKNFIVKMMDDTASSTKCPVICSNGLNSLVIVQTASDNRTKLNIPVVDDIMVMVYYNLSRLERKNQPNEVQFHTFGKLCQNRSEQCFQYYNAFNSQWHSIKTGIIPTLDVTIYVEQNLDKLRIKYKEPSTDQIMFTFYANDNKIDFRTVKDYELDSSTFTTRNFIQPIKLVISKFHSEVVANVNFRILKVEDVNCSETRDAVCIKNCNSNPCILFVRGKSFYVDQRAQGCLKDQFATASKTSTICEYFKGIGQQLCQDLCFDLPNCSYLCAEKNKYLKLTEGGYIMQLENNYEGPIGSSMQHWRDLSPDLVTLDECAFGKNLCNPQDSCIDQKYAFKCQSDSYNLAECLRQKNQSLFWRCPTTTYIPPELPSEENMKNKASEEAFVNDFISSFNTSNLQESQESYRTFSKVVQKIGFGSAAKMSLSSNRKRLGNFIISQFERYLEMLEKIMLTESRKEMTEITGNILTYNTILNNNASEFLFTAPFKRKQSDNEFIKLEMEISSERRISTSSLAYFDDLDFLGENITVKECISKGQTLKYPLLNKTGFLFNGKARFKNSDMFSLKVNRKGNVTVKFRLKTFLKKQSPSWLLSVEEECGYLDTTKQWVWVTNGCVLRQSDTEYYCECNHLTNFAMLFSLKVINEEHLLAFHILSIIAGVITFVSLTLFLVFVLFINSREKMRVDQLNIALCLLLGTFIFMCGAITSRASVLCSVAAAFSQFLFLAAFIWKLILGVNVARMIYLKKVPSVRYRHQTSLKYREDWLIKYRTAVLVIGYAIPLFIVVVSVSIYWSDYREVAANVCWIESSSRAFLTFLMPVGLIIAANVIVLFLIGNVLIQNYLKTRKTKVNESNEIFVFIQLSVSMGLTWIPSYFATQYLIAMYVMVLMYPLQGLLMFLLVVVINKENREKVSSFIHNSFISITSKTSSSADSKSQMKSRSSVHSKITEQSEGLLSGHDNNVKVAIDDCQLLVVNRDVQNSTSM